MTMVNMLEAKTQLSKLVEAVESGAEAEIIIARNGKPAARIVPIVAEVRQPRKLGALDGLYPSISLEEFNEMDEEIARMFTEGDIFPPDDDASAA
ncbi:type II toxin-antitoxin system prevent-host-death family antitoxin [Devosia sp. BK]|uniref:type II toxin-antitoxin system Phd/YefM family antitoxin n=1 Tax=Devosia sp. BK TaxID=2871706 RepID=UPI00293ADC28|nr:type II toxin-antitoxin system prevent-host-death family antitoxin [Devosia sp. BK]MDV3251651.1 type II toxin-antitoxin system prevent-host-death family antitoxin [Devosia sp. BK]